MCCSFFPTGHRGPKQVALDPLTGLGEDAWPIALFYDGQRLKLYIRQRGAYLPSIGVLSFIFEWSAINGEGDVVLV